TTYSSISLEDVFPYKLLKSTHNITIERSWRNVRENVVDQVKAALHSAYGSGLIHDGDPVHQTLVNWIVPPVVQQCLDDFAKVFNSYPVQYQKEKANPSGASRNEIYFNPTRWGGRNCLQNFPEISVIEDFQAQVRARAQLAWVSEEVHNICMGIVERTNPKDSDKKDITYYESRPQCLTCGIFGTQCFLNAPLEEKANPEICDKCRHDKSLGANRQAAHAGLQGAAFRQSVPMPQQGMASGTWVLDERAQRKTALKAGLNSKGPAMQVRILIIHDGKAQEWNPAVFDSLFVGNWKETLKVNLGKALELGQAMWEQGKGEEETGLTYDQCNPRPALPNQKNEPITLPEDLLPLSLHEFYTTYCKVNRLYLVKKDTEQTGFIRIFLLLTIDEKNTYKVPEPTQQAVHEHLSHSSHQSVTSASRLSRRAASAPYVRSLTNTSNHSSISMTTGRTKTIATGQNLAPISNLFAGFRVSTAALQNNGTLSRMANSISQSHGSIFESIQYIKTVFQHRDDGTLFAVQSAPETGLLANKPFDYGSHKQAFEFRHNDIDLVAKKHFRFDKKVWSLAMMSKSINQKLLEMECKKAILLASYLEAFNELLQETYQELDLPTLIYTPCFFIKLISGENSGETFMVEPDLRRAGSYIKINNTDEFIPPDEDEIKLEHQRLYRFMHAFTHFVFHRSVYGAKTVEAREAAMVVIADIQGFLTPPAAASQKQRHGSVDCGQFHLFDLVTHTARGDSSMGDGGAGMLNSFMNAHSSASTNNATSQGTENESSNMVQEPGEGAEVDDELVGDESGI
ncbi:hypothetical protein M231_07889, partial [Tremella mesenterica]